MKKTSTSKANYALKILLDERGTSQIIATMACMGIILLLILFSTETAKFIVTASEQNDLTDSVLHDSLRINNGLTPGTESFLRSAFVEKGFESSRLTITGTPAGVPFGTEVQGQITYEYHMPIFSLMNSFYPNVTVDSMIIRTNAHAYAMGIIR